MTMMDMFKHSLTYTCEYLRCMHYLKQSAFILFFLFAFTSLLHRTSLHGSHTAVGFKWHFSTTRFQLSSPLLGLVPDRCFSIAFQFLFDMGADVTPAAENCCGSVFFTVTETQTKELRRRFLTDREKRDGTGHDRRHRIQLRSMTGFHNKHSNRTKITKTSVLPSVRTSDVFNEDTEKKKDHGPTKTAAR